MISTKFPEATKAQILSLALDTGKTFDEITQEAMVEGLTYLRELHTVENKECQRLIKSKSLGDAMRKAFEVHQVKQVKRCVLIKGVWNLWI